MITSSYSSLLSLSGPYFFAFRLLDDVAFSDRSCFFFSKIRFLFSSSINELFLFPPNIFDFFHFTCVDEFDKTVLFRY